MKAISNNRSPKAFPANDYKSELRPKIGHGIVLSYMLNGKVSKTYSGIIEYVSNSLFGVRVKAGASGFTVSVSFTDLFTGKYFSSCSIDNCAEVF